jgi:hypothetical protein
MFPMVYSIYVGDEWYGDCKNKDVLKETLARLRAEGLHPRVVAQY